MNNLDIKKEKDMIREQISDYSGVGIPTFLRYTDELLDRIDFLQKENESLKKQISKPIIKEKIVYRKR